jgi:hypothetical protein
MLCSLSAREQTAVITDTEASQPAEIEGGTPKRNPLLWGVFGAVVALLPPYRFRDLLDLALPASALIFLIAYFLRSRFAWHVLAANVFIIAPLYVFLSPSWRLEMSLHPGIIWFPVVGTGLFALVVLWSRRRYFTYLEQSEKACRR